MNTLLIIIGTLLALGFAVFVGVHLYAYGYILFDGIQLRKKLKKKNRTIGIREAKKLISEGKGCIFAEAPTIGWNVNRVWWSPDETIKEPDESERNGEICTEEDKSNYERLVALKSGNAKIISIFVFMQRCPKYLARHFGFNTCPVVWSGAVFFDREVKKREEEQSSRGNVV